MENATARQNGSRSPAPEPGPSTKRRTIVKNRKAPDNVIRQQVIRTMRDQPWCDWHFTFVDVKDGVVTFSGFVRDEHVKRGLHALADEVPGVKDVVFLTQKTPRVWIGAP